MASSNTAPHPIRDQYFKTFFVASDNAINYEKFTWFETLWQEPATFILLMASTIFGKISFIVLVPGQGYRPPTVRIRWTTAGLWTALPERKRMWTARGKGWGSYRPQRPRFSSKTRKTRTLSVTEVNSNGAQKVWRLLDHCIIVLNINFQVEPLFSSSGDNDQVKN